MNNNRHQRLFHINITSQCQLACSHCYIDKAISNNTQVLSIDKMQEIANIIKDTNTDIHIIGGEPTLVSIDTHKKYLSILSTLKGSKIMLATALQNTRALKIAKLYQNIATSYDPDARDNITNNQINQWLERCRELIEQGHNLNVCVTLSKSVIDYGVSRVLDEIYQYGFRVVHLSAMVPTLSAVNETPDPMITSKAMIESAQWVVKKRKNNKNNNKQNILVYPFDGLLQDMDNYDGLSCAAGQSCVNVQPNGQIHACVAKGGEISTKVNGNPSDEINVWFNDKLSDDANGNISDDANGNIIDKSNSKIKDKDANAKAINNAQIPPIKEQLSSNSYRLEVAQHNRVRTQCLGCEFWTTCKGGCRVLVNTKIAKDSDECGGFKTFLNYVRQHSEL